MDSFAPTPPPSVTWHIVWQTVEGRNLVASAALAERIRRRLLEAHAAADRALLSYLLAPTEMHLLSRLPSGTSPGDVARTIGNIVARWVREAQGRPGMVFAGRYRAYPVGSNEAARGELQMLAWRPVVLGLCVAPTHYASSSLRATLGLSRSTGFDTLPPLRLFDDSVPRARTALRDLIAKRPGAIELRQWELTRGMALAPGGAGPFSPMARPVGGLAAALVAASQPPGIDGALRLLERWVLLRLGGHDEPGATAAASPAGARSRALVASLAVRLDLCSAASVARYFHRAKATLSERMAAARVLPEDKAIVGTPLDRVVEEAVALARLPPGGAPATSRRSTEGCVCEGPP